MIGWVLAGWIGAGILWQWYKLGFPLNPLIVLAAVLGTLRGVWYFVVTNSVWVILWYALVVVSADILTPPYLLGPEFFLAIPITYLAGSYGLSYPAAVIVGFLAVFVLAALIIVAHFMFMRKFLKEL
jgi:predicted neutral ceramidase superfamily lipid hydrolase